jgi:hypothetical protein
MPMADPPVAEASADTDSAAESSVAKTGDADATTAGDLAAAACHEPLRAVWGELETRFSEGLLATLRSGLDAHAKVIEATGLGGDPPEGWRARADAVLEYRKVAGGALLEPLVAAFSGHSPARATIVAVSEALEQAEAACLALAPTLSAEWKADALDSRRTDRVGRRFGKLLARAAGHPKAGREREVPLRAVAARHFRDAVAPAVDELAESTLVAWLAWSRRLETAWLDWGEGAFPLFVRAELPGEDDAGAVWAALAHSVQGLQSDLVALVDGAPYGGCTAHADGRMDELRGSLEDDLTVAGSFVYRPDVPGGPPPGLPRASRRTRAAEAWDEGVAARLRMYVALLGILAGVTAVQRRLIWRFRERCVGPLAGLPDVAEALDALAGDLPEAEDLAVAALEDLKAKVDLVIAPALAAVPDGRIVEASVTEGSDATVEALLSMMRQAPVTLALHAEDERPPSAARPADTRTLALQDLARQSFDALRIERIRSATVGLIDSVTQVRANLDALPDVFEFAYDEAVRELEGRADGAGGRARDLLREALQSMSEALRGQLRGLETAVAGAEERLAAEVSSGSTALLDRVAAGGMQARLLAVRSRAADLRAWINETWGPPVDRAFRVLALRFAALRRWLSRSLRRGTAIVGSAPGAAADSTRTLRRLADASAVVDRLPLVYQRLFTLDPLAEPALIAGRTAELADALGRWLGWRQRDGVPLIVRGRPGTGITSFVNVLAARIEEDGVKVSRVAFEERVENEEALSRLLAEGLGLAATCSLDELATAVFDADADALPAAIAVDNLEHVYLRVPGGTALLERLLTLMAETEPRLWWIGGVTTSAWQLIASAEPTAVSQVELLELLPLGSDGVRAAVTVRHRRSGLPVRFEEPSSGRRLLRRRLRRIRDPGAYQDLLENDFFERLHRSSSGHLPLALFEWLEIADFESGEGVIMKAPDRPDFSVLESLDLTQNFTLKGFVEHRTLTLDEHDRIFRLPRHESYQIFESLGNRSLIEAVATPDGPQRSEIGEGLRYRVPPLLTGAVIAHLRARNIVH